MLKYKMVILKVDILNLFSNQEQGFRYATATGKKSGLLEIMEITD